jgi:hypothetical protein
MSGFVATASTPNAGDALTNDGWFPDLHLSALREIIRLDGTVTDARLRDVARYAILEVNRQLAAYKAEHAAAGITRLEDVAGDRLDGINRLSFLYGRAVAAQIKAELVERYRDLDISDTGLRRVVDMEPSIGEYRRNASWAVRDILGEPHTVVELI